ncbi:MAG: hypothetical protein SNF33_03615 [Candidatus Algichlamydia australiensis]|nr:hypothetical protein [Chlamydiales bacterium]
MLGELRSWFNFEKRDFPWREEVTPYRVWVSEVMLQQTRANVVIPYFLRWMELFPTVRDLAKAPEEKVLKCWEGLGYYSRARNLQKGQGASWPNLAEGFLQTQRRLPQLKELVPTRLGQF